MRRTALALFLAVASTAAAQSPSTEAITTRDGRRYVGVVTAHGKALRIRTPLRDIYLSTANVAERKAAPAPPPPPIFRRNAELLAKPKKAKVGMVVDKITWGRWLAVDRLEGSFVDFELGKLQTVFVISQITPYSVRMESVDYDKIFEFELKTFANVLPQLIEVGAGNAPATLAKQVRFYRLAGMHDRARAVIGRLRKVAPDHAAITAEQLAMETQRLRRTLDDADRLARSGRVAEAAKVLADPTPSFVLKSDAPALVARLTADRKALADRLAVRARLLAWLAKAVPDAAALTLTVEQAERIAHVVGLEGDAAKRTPPAWLVPRLPERWTDGLTALDTWDDKPIREAADLADALATFFARTDDKPTGAAALASRLRKSRLPRALKLALLGKAARHPDVETGTWRRVEWKHPTMRKTFHYYVQVPRCYRPGRPTPVLVSLHGQTSTAERQRLLWGEHAERHGFILISPEYIYGRRWGYKHSAEEHAAIVGALRHAGRTLSIDTDRVFIQGGSQGGHTSWDVGSTRSGLFAGVLPLIGILVFQDGLHNFPNTAVYCIDGELDGQAPVHNRRTIDQLSAAGCDAVYVEYRDRGHEAFTEEYDAVCRWMHRRVRTRTAGKLVHVGLRKTDLRCRWLQVDAKLPSRATGGHYVHLKAQVHKGPRETDILITTDRARRVSVLVDPDVVDLSLPLHVRVDGKTRFRGAVKIDWRFALESSYHRRDRQERFVRRLTFPVRRR